MAAGNSGSFELAGTKGITVKVNWSDIYDVAENKSIVHITRLQVKGAYWHGITYFLTGTIVVNGTPVIEFSATNGSHYAYITAQNTYADVVAASSSYKDAPWESEDIVHNSDGNKSIAIAVNISGYVVDSTDYGNGWSVSGTKTVVLTQIPRASTIDSLSCATKYFTGKLTYKYTPKSASYYNRCIISLNQDGTHITVKSIKLGKKTAAQQTATVTLSASELETIYKKLPSTTKGVLRFTLRTYSDSGYSNQIGDAGYKEVVLSIPNDSTTKASVSMSLAPVSSLGSAFDGFYIQGKTKVKAALTATGKYGATIKSYSMKAEGISYGADDGYTSRDLSQYGTIKVYGYAKDSRGYTGSISQDITVLPYSDPQLVAASGESEVVAARCDADGNLSDSGTYLKIKAKRSYSIVESGGVQKNFCQIRYRYKLASAASWSSWTTILAGSDLTTDEIVTDALLGGVLSVKSTYQVQVQAIDDVGGYAETVVTIPTDIIHSHKTKNGLGLGKYCEGENLLDVGWNAHFHGDVLIGDEGLTLKEYIQAVISEGG